MSEKVKQPFLRPNLSNQGEVPPVGDISSSPDIWCAGIHPVADFQNALKQPEIYDKMSDEVTEENMVNYLYVRCKNGSEEPASMQVQLYQTKASVVCWPSQWTLLDVDNRKDNINCIPEMAPGEIGVVEAPFVWKRPTRTMSGDEYCFIARLFSDKYYNPKPTSMTPIYMASMIQNNLLWAEQNITRIKYNPNVPVVCADVNINVPVDTQYAGNQWIIAVKWKKLNQWDIQVQSSRTDSSGTEIFLKKINLATEPYSIIMGEYNFIPGFFTDLSVQLYPNSGVTQPDKGAEVIIRLAYYTQPIEMEEANALKAFNPSFLKEVRSLRQDIDSSEIYPVLVGEYKIVIY